MPIEVGLVAEHLGTVIACCISCVALHVAAEGPLVLEAFATYCTAEWSFTSNAEET